MYYRIFNDPDSADFFRKTDKHLQIQRMIAFFTYTTGGAEEWEGKSMKEVHQGRGMSSWHFERVMDHVVAAMTELGIVNELIKELVDRFSDIKPAFLEEE